MATKKKKDAKRQEALARKSAIQSLEFLTMWGLKQLGYDDGCMCQTYAKTELNYINELGLTEDLLSLKQFIDKVKHEFGQSVVVGMCDFTRSVVCLALGMGRIEEFEKMEISIDTWKELIAQKLLTIYYPESIRNEIVIWAGENGFNMSTYLGRPVLKLNKIFVLIERAKDA